MSYEFEDYRKKHYHDPGPWLTWAVPQRFTLKYLFRLMLWLWIIPLLLFGTSLSPVGMLVQLLVVDYLSWIQYRTTNII